HDRVDANHRAEGDSARTILTGVEREEGDDHAEADQIDENGEEKNGEGHSAHLAREWYKRSRVSKLVLFDIDGTLISDGGVSREAFAAALREVFDYRGDPRRYDFSGRTDPQIAHMVLRDAGWSERQIDEQMQRLWDKYIAALEQHQRSRVRELPGVRSLLDALRDNGWVTLALLTGNIERGARLKLSGPALNEYFAFGAFGSDSPHREELPPIAIHRAAEFSGHRFRGR